MHPSYPLLLHVGCRTLGLHALPSLPACKPATSYCNSHCSTHACRNSQEVASPLPFCALSCSNCERAGKLKGAKNQARLLRQLEGEMATVQQLLQAKREKLNPSAAAKGTTTAGSGSGRRSSVDGSERGKGRSRREAAASSPLPYGMEPCDYSSEDEDQGSSGSAASRSSSGRRRSSSRRRSVARSSGAAAPAVLYSDEE